MDKKGILIESIFAGIILSLTIAGTFLVLTQGQHIYVGDSENKQVYDYSKCKEQVDKISLSNQVVFNSVEEAESSGYVISEGCV